MNLGELRTMVRGFLNEPVAAFWSDAELNGHINVGHRKLYNFIRNLSQYNFTTRVTFQTVVNQEYYKLPGDLKSMKLISILNDNNDEEWLDYNPWPHPENWTTRTALSTDVTGFPQAFWMMGDSLRISPIPADISTIRIYYEARLVDLTADADVPASDVDYHDMCAIWAGIMARPKDKVPSDDLKDLYKSRENDCLRDILMHLPSPQELTEGYLQGYT